MKEVHRPLCYVSPSLVFQEKTLLYASSIRLLPLGDSENTGTLSVDKVEGSSLLWSHVPKAELKAEKTSSFSWKT